MRSSISSSDALSVIAAVSSADDIAAPKRFERPGFVRLTASDRPGVAQPVPQRDIPPQPWRAISAATLAMTLVLTVFWEWRMRALELSPGDLGDSASAWVEQRHRVDAGDIPVAIIGDSRILFDTDLDRFETLTGVRPLQLALPGTNARPILENLAADPRFTGVAIVGITEVSYFRKELGRFGDALKTYRYESPARRASFLIHRGLSRALAFLDDDYRFSKLVQRVDPDLRADVQGPYDDVWKIWVNADNRQTWLWPRIEHDARLREHARAAWRWGSFAGDPVSDDIIKMTMDATRSAVAAIRARGGDVVFVRPPSAPELRVREDRRLPRSRGWDALLEAAQVRGIHFDDESAMQGLVIPEYSHLSRACATVFTDTYVRRLTELVPRIKLLGDVPSALAPKDCALGAGIAPRTGRD
jgi:hypothetical protein